MRIGSVVLPLAGVKAEAAKKIAKAAKALAAITLVFARVIIMAKVLIRESIRSLDPAGDGPRTGRGTIRDPIGVPAVS
jgi:hypothetical protein